MRVYAVTYEYSYPNSTDGSASPDDAGGIIAIYEDEADARARLENEEKSGEWGDFSNAEDASGWSTGGYMLHVEGFEVIPPLMGHG